MTREHSIPLFLWIATAIVAHAIGGGGATEVARVLQERQDISSFARSVRKQASLRGKPVEVSLLEEESAQPPPSDAPEPEATEADKKSEAEPEPKPVPVKKPEEQKKEEQKKLLEKKPEEQKKEALPLEKKPSPPVPPPQGRIAVQQHVKDKQEDNPNARYAAEQANHTAEETRARITSTDQNSEQPSPGGQFAGKESEPGNSNEHKVAQSDESKGEKDLPPDTEQPTPVASAQLRPTAPTPPPAAVQKPSGEKAPPRQATQTAQTSQSAATEQAAALEALTGGSGRWAIPPGQNARAAQAARKKLPEQRSTRPTDLLGYGSTTRTANGVNLNLTPQMAEAAIGADRLAMERRKVGERRLSQHRGSWKSLGLERWKPALENYVATVKPGNQTNLNTAHVPFSRYLNEIHNRIHPVFADGFLSHLTRLPANDPLNNPEMSTHLEVQLSGQDGRVLRLGITKSSGVTAFDVGALDSVQRAGPYGVPPGAILSSDGNVYLHWEFHRKPELACSTYFARPYILNLKPDSAPPRVEPPPAPTYDAPRGDQRTGSLDPSTHDHAGPTGDGVASQHPPG